MFFIQIPSIINQLPWRIIMSEYKIKDKGIKGDTEPTSAISTISYEIENAKYHDLSSDKINQQIKKLQRKGKFPPTLSYIDAFYDSSTSLSGVAFMETTTGRVTIGFAGTNLDNGFKENIKDLGADFSIVYNGPTNTSDYFAQGTRFIERMKNEYPVETITGHSKGGRDAVVLGVANNIQNIVTYNSAPVTNDFLQTIASFQHPFQLGERSFAQADMKQQFLNYQGSIVQLVSNEDWLTRASDLGKFYYVGSRYTMNNAKSHEVTGFLTTSEQTFIRLILAEHSQIGGMVDPELAQAITKQNMENLSLLEKKILKNSGGTLSNSKKIYLDAARALTLTQGMKQTVQSKIKELKERYQSAIEQARELWRQTLTEAKDNGNKLTYYEQLAALKRGSATETTLCTKPIAEYEFNIRKLTAIEEKYDKLITQIDTVIKNQITADEELARQLGRM